MNDGSPVSVGIGGDGDEVVAIQDVERLFNVQLDFTSDEPRWITAGDVLASLEKVLLAERCAGTRCLEAARPAGPLAGPHTQHPRCPCSAEQSATNQRQGLGACR